MFLVSHFCFPPRLAEVCKNNNKNLIMAFSNKKSTILFIFAAALSSLLSLINVEATSRGLQDAAAAQRSEEVDPTLKRLCFSAEFPHECASAVVPFMESGGTINAQSVLQAGLKLLAQRCLQAIEQAEKLKKESKSKEMTDQLNFCEDQYRTIGNSTKQAAEALPAREFNKLESQLGSMVTAINECEAVFPSGKSPIRDVNLMLKMAVKNNLNIGNFVAMPIIINT